MVNSSAFQWTLSLWGASLPCGNIILPIFTMFFLTYNMKDMEFKKGGHEAVRTEWEGGDMHCCSWVKMEMKASRALEFLSHLGRNVLLFGSFSYLCLILEALSGCGKSRNCNRLLETSFEYHSPFIHNCTTHFCFVIFFIYDNMDNFFQYHTPLLCFSSHSSLHDIYKIIVYKICIISD